MTNCDPEGGKLHLENDLGFLIYMESRGTRVGVDIEGVAWWGKSYGQVGLN